VRFLCAKGLNAKDIKKETFPVYGGTYLSLRAVRDWLEKFSHRYSKVADDARWDAEVAETTVQILLPGGFGSTGQAMG
jgi:hypothetical protein